MSGTRDTVIENKEDQCQNQPKKVAGKSDYTAQAFSQLLQHLAKHSLTEKNLEQIFKKKKRKNAYKQYFNLNSCITDLIKYGILYIQNPNENPPCYALTDAGKELNNGIQKKVRSKTQYIEDLNKKFDIASWKPQENSFINIEFCTPVNTPRLFPITSELPKNNLLIDGSHNDKIESHPQLFPTNNNESSKKISNKQSQLLDINYKNENAELSRKFFSKLSVFFKSSDMSKNKKYQFQLLNEQMKAAVVPAQVEYVFKQSLTLYANILKGNGKLTAETKKNIRYLQAEEGHGSPLKKPKK